MATIIEDTELLSELEELYLVSKHWISDLEFLKGDLDFLRNLFTINTAMLVKGREFEAIADTMISIAKSKKEQESLKKEITDYLDKLAELILDTHQPIGLEVLESYTALEGRLQRTVERLKYIKANVLALSKKEIKLPVTPNQEP